MIIAIIVAALMLMFGFVVFFGAPYVPTHRSEAIRAFESLYTLSSHDVLVDVGSGDGIILRLASERGARAVGYELNPILVALSRYLSRRYKNISVSTANFWYKQLPDDTTIVYAFIVTRDAERMVKKIQKESDRLGRNISVVTYGAKLSSIEPVATHRAHSLYEFRPLH